MYLLPLAGMIIAMYILPIAYRLLPIAGMTLAMYNILPIAYCRNDYSYVYNAYCL